MKLPVVIMKMDGGFKVVVDHKISDGRHKDRSLNEIVDQ